MIAARGFAGKGANKAKEGLSRLHEADLVCNGHIRRGLRRCSLSLADMPLPIPRHAESFRRPRRRWADDQMMMSSEGRRSRRSLKPSYSIAKDRTSSIMGKPLLF
jgi:hypothetical protein